LAKKTQIILLSLVIIIFALVASGIFDWYVYPALDTSNFPLKQIWLSHLDAPILELSVDDIGLFIFARTAHALYAIDAATGQEIWRFPINNQVVTSPSISHNGIVYIADKKNLWALNQKNGNIIWSQSLLEPRGKVEAVTDFLIFINNRNTDIGSYDAKTGSLIWTFPLYWYHPKYYIRENKIYIPYAGSGLYIIDTSTDKQYILNKADSIFDSSLHGNHIYYITLHNIVAFNTKNETETWRRELVFSKNDYPRLGMYEQIIFVEGTESLTALDSKTGDLDWTTSISYPTNPSVIGDTVFVMEGYSRIIRALQIATGKQIGQLRTSSYHFVIADGQRDMIAADNRLIFSRGKEILCFTPINK